MGRPTSQRIRDRLKPWLVGRESSDGEARGFCPVCEDPGESTTPSASFNFGEGVFTCFSQCGGMTINALVQMMENDGDFKAYEPDKPGKAQTNGHVRDIEDAPSLSRSLPTENKLEILVERLLTNRLRMRELREKRGYTKETIKKYQIGWDGRRYTIPVRDRQGELVNVRKYQLDAKDPKDKMRSWAQGTGKGRLFLPDILDESETVIITEGETDALIGRQYELPAMSHTSGAGVWKEEWNEEFRDKIVYFCYDCDQAGKRGARKAAKSLDGIAKQVFIIDLPLKGKGDDLTNYFVDQGYTASDFYELMANASEQVARVDHVKKAVSKEPEKATLEGTMNPKSHESPITFTGTVAGKVQPVFIAPKFVEMDCNEGGGNRCGHCPISGRNHKEFSVQKHDPLALRVINANENQRRQTILKYAGIPHTCPDVEVHEKEVYSVEELIVVPPVDEQYGAANRVDRKVYNVGPYDTPVNTKIKFTGMNFTGRNDSRVELQTWESERSDSDIDRFEMTKEKFRELSAFWPEDDQTPIQKMTEIVKDIEANVTKIYNRKALHFAYDLVWHSALDFRFKGVDVGKGWLELLVIGDTRTGKSEAAKRLCHHYRAGVLTTCEGATFAGLVGGVQQLASTWVVSWGTVPLNDRRLVVLDEFGGIAEKGIIEQMSSVRSSGVAQINKIRSAETSARTRLIWIANPVDGNTIESYANGAMDAIKGLAKNPEDVARFDFALAVSGKEVSSDQINTQKAPRVTHRYTQKLCSQLVSWVWSRNSDQIVWEPNVENYVLERAKELGRKYIPEPPLIQVENIRIKLARLAVAVAGRLFSTDDTGDLLVVDFEHVEAAEKLLHAFYSMESFGYAEHSENVIYERQEAEKNKKAVRNYLSANEDVLTTLKQCMSGPFKMRDFQEFGSMSQAEAQEVIRVLQSNRMIRRMSKGYIRCEPALIDIVKRLDRGR